jgi:ribosomal protein S12 methylthiotransferase accessory factor
MEVVQVRAGAVPRHRQEPPRLMRYEDVRALEDHGAFAAMSEHLGEFGFLLEGTASVNPAPPPQAESELDWVVERLQTVGARVAIVDITQPDIEPLGIRIVRALATGLQPIHFGFGQERLGGPRVREEELNPCPHPIA